MKKVLLLLTLLIGFVGSMRADTYSLVTDVSQLSEGDRVVIVSTLSSTDYSLSNATLGVTASPIPKATVTFDGEGRVVNPTENGIMVFDLFGNATDGWRLYGYLVDRSGWLGNPNVASGSKANLVADLTDDNRDNFTWDFDLSQAKNTMTLRGTGGATKPYSHLYCHSSYNWRCFQAQTAAAYCVPRIYKRDPQTADPVFEGFVGSAFFGSFDLTLAPAAGSNNTQVYYRFDEPESLYTVDVTDGSWTLYDAPITISESCTVYAVAQQPGLPFSYVVQRSFVRAGAKEDFSNVYRRVYSNADIKAGDHVVLATIVGNTTNYGGAGSVHLPVPEFNTASNRQSILLETVPSFNDGELLMGIDDHYLTSVLEGDAENGWRFYCENPTEGFTGYIGRKGTATTSTLILKESLQDESLATFAIDLEASSNRIGSFDAVTYSSNPYLYGYSSIYLSFYPDKGTNTQYQQVYLYKLDTSSVPTLEPQISLSNHNEFFGTNTVTLLPNVATESANGDVVIYYTTDTEADAADYENWTVYTTPLEVAEDMTIRAIARQGLLDPSSEVSTTLKYLGPQELYRNAYVRVHEVSELQAGDIIALVSDTHNAEDKPFYSLADLEPATSYFQATNVELASDELLINPQDILTLTLEGDQESGWYFKANGDNVNGYIGHKTATSSNVAVYTAEQIEEGGLQAQFSYKFNFHPGTTDAELRKVIRDVGDKFSLICNSATSKARFEFNSSSNSLYFGSRVYRFDKSSIVSYDPVVSATAEVFYGSTVVSAAPSALTDETLGETSIYYSMTEPTAEFVDLNDGTWTLYTEPLTISETTTIYFAARQGSLLVSDATPLTVTRAGSEDDYRNAYIRVHDASELNDGDVVIFVSDTPEKLAYYTPNPVKTVASSGFPGAEVSLITDELIVNPSIYLPLILHGNNEDGWKLEAFTNGLSGYFGAFGNNNYTGVTSPDEISDEDMDKYTFTFNLAPGTSATERRTAVKIGYNDLYMVNEISTSNNIWRFTSSLSSSKYNGARIYRLDVSSSQTMDPVVTCEDVDFFGSTTVTAAISPFTNPASGETSIYYTATAPAEGEAIDLTDGTWTLYTEPITVEETSTLYFVALQGSLRLSDVVSVSLTRKGDTADFYNVYRRVTDASQLAEGDQIIIVSHTGGLHQYFTIDTTAKSGYFNAAPINLVNDNLIVNPSTVLPMTLVAGAEEGQWKLMVETDDWYGIFGSQSAGTAVTDPSIIANEVMSSFTHYFTINLSYTADYRNTVRRVAASTPLVYNHSNGRWTYSTTTSSSIYGTRIYRLDKNYPVVESLAAPTIASSEGTSFMTDTEITISSVHKRNFEIFYTTEAIDAEAAVDVTDGTWTLYEAPFTVSETTTVSAVVVRGTSVSPVASLKVTRFNSYATVEELLEKSEVGELCVLAGPVVVEGVYNGGLSKYLFVNDVDTDASLMIYNFNSQFPAYTKGELISNLLMERAVYGNGIPAGDAAKFASTYPAHSSQHVDADAMPEPTSVEGWSDDILGRYVIFESSTLYEDEDFNVLTDLADGTTVQIEPEFGIYVPDEIDGLFDIEGYAVELNSSQVGVAGMTKAPGEASKYIYLSAIEPRSAAPVIIIEEGENGVSISFAADEEATPLPAGATVRYTVVSGADVSEDSLDELAAPTATSTAWDGTALEFSSNVAIKAAVSENGKRLSKAASRFIEYDKTSGISLVAADVAAEATVYDIHGRLVSDTRHLAPGVYIFRNGTSAVKVLVK